MYTLLIIVVALGIIFEIASLRRDPDKVEMDYILSSQRTEPGVSFNVQAIVTNKSRVPISYLAVREIYPPDAVIPPQMEFREKNNGLHIKKVCRVNSRQRKKLTMETSI